MSKFLALAAAAMLVLSGCNQNTGARWTAFQDNFINRSFELDPTFGAGQGKHEYDGRLPDWSEAGLTAAIDFLKTSITDAEAFTGLNAAQTYQRDYLVAVARRNLFWLEAADQPHTNPAFYLGSLSPSMYVARPYAAADVRLAAAANGTSLHVDMDAGDLMLCSDQHRLSQCLRNLLSNAVKFVDAGRGRVWVALAECAEGLRVDVRDNGPGLTPEEQLVVFEKFRQGGNTMTDKPQGTGLGLPISRQIVEHYGGRLWVESAAGEGACFSFLMPCGKSTETKDEAG